MIKLPDSIKIGGRIFTVKFPHVFTENTAFKGQVDFGSQQIRVGNVSLSGAVSHVDNHKESLIHEIIHAVDVIYNSDQFDEDTILRISEGLFQVLKDNPELVKVFLPEKK